MTTWQHGHMVTWSCGHVVTWSLSQCAHTMTQLITLRTEDNELITNLGAVDTANNVADSEVTVSQGAGSHAHAHRHDAFLR